MLGLYQSSLFPQHEHKLSHLSVSLLLCRLHVLVDKFADSHVHTMLIAQLPDKRCVLDGSLNGEARIFFSDSAEKSLVTCCLQDDESSGHIEDEHHAIFDCSGYTYAFSGPFPESHHIYQPVSQPATMQQAGQVPYLDQNDAHEQSLGQSDGSLPGPKQTLNQAINQSKTERVQLQ